MPATVIPIFRIFDRNKAIEFYINWLGFKSDWEHHPTDTPAYMQISLGDTIIHLSEHHADSTPGSRIMIENFEGLKQYHQKLIDKQYKYMKPGLDKAPWNANYDVMEVIDPFGNRLTFTGEGT